MLSSIKFVFLFLDAPLLSIVVVRETDKKKKLAQVPILIKLFRGH